MRGFFRKQQDSSESLKDPVGMVLVVDDSPTERQYMKTILTRAGYQVEFAEDGQQGLAMARALKPDLVLMDVVMPNLNGFQATRQLRRDESTATIPVIIVSTKDQATDKDWGMRQGANDYLVKPVDEQELLDSMKRLLS